MLRGSQRRLARPPFLIPSPAQLCAMSEVAAETAAEQGIRATCPATPMLSDA
jgi:hypothetical protein